MLAPPASHTPGRHALETLATSVPGYFTRVSCQYIKRYREGYVVFCSLFFLPMRRRQKSKPHTGRYRRLKAESVTNSMVSTVLATVHVTDEENEAGN